MEHATISYPLWYGAYGGTPLSIERAHILNARALEHPWNRAEKRTC